MKPQAYALIAIIIVVLIIIITVVLIKFSTGSTFILPPSPNPPASTPVNSSSTISGGSLTYAMTPPEVNLLGIGEDPASNNSLPDGFKQIVQSFNNVYFSSSDPSLIGARGGGSFLTINIDSQLKSSSTPTTSYSYSYRNNQLISSETGRLVGRVKIYGSSTQETGDDRYLITDLDGNILNSNSSTRQTRFRPSGGFPGTNDWLPLYLEILRRVES